MGRLGVRQLTAGSDLDLLIIHHAAPDTVSTGKRKLGAASYVLRLAQTMISWISTPTTEGTLYDVDLRLRPEGKAGAIATSLDRLATYFERDAWVWERLALTKARPIAGDAGLNGNIQKFINGIVQHNHPQESLITAVADMRQRLQKQVRWAHPEKWPRPIPADRTGRVLFGRCARCADAGQHAAMIFVDLLPAAVCLPCDTPPL